MDVAPGVRATECPAGAMDWATIGRRIVRAAAMATAVRVVEGGSRRAGEQGSRGEGAKDGK